MVALGLLILPLVVLTSSLHVWLERAAIADGLAHQAARAMAIAPDWESGIDAVDQMQQREETRIQSGPRPCPEENGCVSVRLSGELVRGGRVGAEVRVWMPALVVPFVGGGGGFWWSAGHTEVVDPYRSIP